MVRIMLACAAGMSTSLLVEKMKMAAEDQNIEAEIFAIPEAEISAYEGKFDVCLLGPQVRFKLRQVKYKAGDKYPVDVIEMAAYGKMDGAKVFAFAMDLYNDFYKNRG